MKLSELQPGQIGVITKVMGRGAFRRRIIEMGFVRGKKVEVITKAPLQDPIEYKIMDYEVSLRKSEAELIEVVTPEEAQDYFPSTENNLLVSEEDRLTQIAREKSRIINVALVGNPNSGKTSLFNIASGMHERVGNYSGVTIDAKYGKFRHNGYTFNLIDLPGTYSLSPYSPEELFVREQIEKGIPDIIINVVSASALERNLYLTTQLIDMDATTVIALNMYDELEKSGATFDHGQLGKMIGCPIVPTVAKSARGIPDLFDKVIEVYEGKDSASRHIHINYGTEIESGIEQIKKLLKAENAIGIDTSKRYLSILLLGKDKEAEKAINSFPDSKTILKERDACIKKIQEDLREDIETAFTDARYGFIDGALKQTYRSGEKDTLKITHLIDKLVTDRFWGYPIFLSFMFIMFQATFILGEYPMAWIEEGVQFLGQFIGNYMPEGSLKSLLIDGIIGGVGSVIVFLPNIIILYLFISFMEDTGYMARAAFIMDKFMQKMGLHGKSFIPLVMGFGCNVPAIMGTRIIESRNVRLITMLINPLMSCSARLPVYILLIGAFFPKNGGLILFGIYISGIILAILMARLFKKFLIKGEDLPFVMELPPYRMPTVKAMFRHMWEKSSQYLRKMGGIILVASVLIWFLEYYPKNEILANEYQDKIAQVENQYDNLPDKTEERDLLIKSLEKEELSKQQEYSYIGRLGKWTEPIVKPLGFDWKISVSLLSGMAAKEIVVSTIGILYTGDETDEKGLQQRLLSEKKPDGTPVFTTLTVISLLLFTLIYFPCVATIAAIKNESGSWKWALFTIAYTTSLAWTVSFLVYQIGSFFV